MILRSFNPLQRRCSCLTTRWELEEKSCSSSSKTIPVFCGPSWPLKIWRSEAKKKRKGMFNICYLAALDRWGGRDEWGRRWGWGSKPCRQTGKTSQWFNLGSSHAKKSGWGSIGNKKTTNIGSEGGGGGGGRMRETWKGSIRSFCLFLIHFKQRLREYIWIR